jgi:hypothetical protein
MAPLVDGEDDLRLGADCNPFDLGPLEIASDGPKPRLEGSTAVKLANGLYGSAFSRLTCKGAEQVLGDPLDDDFPDQVPLTDQDIADLREAGKFIIGGKILPELRTRLR